MALSGADFAALSPLQQQAYLNGDPNYLSAAPAAPTPAATQTAEITGLASSDNYVVIPFGASSEQVWTLDTYLSQWAAAAITMPASLQGQDPVSQAAAIAQQRCTAIPTPDCAQMTQLATQYGNQVRAAVGAAAIPAAAPAATPSAAPSPAIAPTAPAPAPTSTAPTPGAAAPQSVYSTPATVLKPRLTAGGGITTGVSTALDYIPIIGPILGSLVGVLFGGADLSGLTKAVNQLANEVGQLGDSITRFTWSVANAVGALWEFQAETWDNFLDQFWTNFKNVWKALWKHLAETIPAILKILHDARQQLDKIYQKYIRPIMSWIQIARRFLIFLKLLHVPFAQKLDRILGQIQGAVFAPFLYVLRWLNGYGSWFNVILTAELILQKPIFLRTMYAYQGDWINMFWAAQTSGHTVGAAGSAVGAVASPTQFFTAAGPNPASQAPPPETTVDSVDSCAAFGLWATTSSGPLEADADNALMVLLASVL